jgi:TM2 domain-containing membrane protein YozV
VGYPHPSAPHAGQPYGPPPGQPHPQAYGPPPQAQGYGQPPQQMPPGVGAAPPWPSPHGQAMQPMPFAQGPGGYGMVDPLVVKAASQDPQHVFLAELLGSGLFCLPGIGHLMIGDTGMGLALLLGYPLVVGGFWTIIILFTCGIGSLLVWVQLPINFLVGYLLGERVKKRVEQAKLQLGQR